MSDVIDTCLRTERSYVVDQLVQDYVVDRECAKRGIIVSDADIDKAVKTLRKNLAPSTLEQAIAAHHSSMEYVRNAFKEKLERVQLVEDQVPDAKIVHCRAIVIRFAASGMPASVAGTTRTAEEAQALIKDIQTQITQGKDFGNLADKYTEAAQKNDKGDYGMIYSGESNTDNSLITVALSLIKGEIYPGSVKLGTSYALVQAVSTNDDHGVDEDGAYAIAKTAYKQQQAQFIYPQFVVDLINKSKITFASDDDINTSSGKPLPDAAAVVDGHPIPMQAVLSKCIEEDGPQTVDTFVQNYLVDQECKRRHIVVTDAQIDQRINDLTNQIKPHTMDEALKSRHTTLANLRYDFKQEIERSRLVIDRVPSTKIVHCRAITILFAPADGSQSPGGATRSEADALALIQKIQNQLAQGKDFGELADQYTEASPKPSHGDLGMLWATINGVETPILDAGLAMDKGGITPKPIKIINGYCLVQTVSTNSNHPKSEDRTYADAVHRYKEQQAPTLETTEIVDLIKKSKIVYNIHA